MSALRSILSVRSTWNSNLLNEYFSDRADASFRKYCNSNCVTLVIINNVVYTWHISLLLVSYWSTGNTKYRLCVGAARPTSVTGICDLWSLWASWRLAITLSLRTKGGQAMGPQIARFIGPTWGPPGSCRPQMGPMLAPWTLLSGPAYTDGPRRYG